MKIFNTLSRKIEEIEPINPPKIGLYACGPTVYENAHLGHLRKFSMDDILVRTLSHAGFEVKFVQNVTDVGHLTSDSDTGEDKMEKGARKHSQSVWDLSRQFTKLFYVAMEAIGNVRPDVVAIVTDHIKEQLVLVEKLEKLGYTYVIDGDGVYFDVSKFADYGKLAGLKLESQLEGSRVGKVEGKRNPADFALWKFERPGENRQMAWESPWHSRSFPGWHIECSAISMKYLGEQIDIHTGGIDHIPVHHTNEIAQSEAASGKSPFVKYWVHHNFLKIEGEKMSKSLNNFFTINDVVKRGFAPQSLRLLFLMAHYRSEMNFTWENLKGAQVAYEKLKAKVIELKNETKRSTVKSLSKKGKEYSNKFFSLMEDDLKTPEALAVMWEMLKSNLPDPEKLILLIEFDKVFVLGIKQMESQEIPQKIQQIVDQRAQARKYKDWNKSDELRDQLAKMGYSVKDFGDGFQQVKEM